MKPYSAEIEIHKPREHCVSLFQDSDNHFFWQTGLQSIDLLSGIAGQPEARSMLIFLSGRHRIVLEETVIANDLPDSFTGRYQWSGGMNTLVTEFVEHSESTTLMRCHCEYTFTSLMMKLMGLLFPGKFREGNLGHMTNFKAFCEQGTDCREK